MASGASPRPPTSVATVDAVTSGWSPSISTSSWQRGSITARAAAIDDEQPLPYASFTTTSAPSRSTAPRTSSAAAPIATISWSKRQLRATLTTWPSSVVPAKGSSCLGRPRRLEPPAPSTSPATNPSVGEPGMPVLCLVLGPATVAAEVHNLTVARQGRRAGHGRHRHPADRVNGQALRAGGRLSGAGRIAASMHRGGAAVSHGDDPGQDRQRDLGRRAGPDVDAGRNVDPGQQLVRHAVSAQLGEHAGAA